MIINNFSILLFINLYFCILYVMTTNFISIVICIMYQDYTSLIFYFIIFISLNLLFIINKYSRLFDNNGNENIIILPDPFYYDETITYQQGNRIKITPVDKTFNSTCTICFELLNETYIY